MEVTLWSAPFWAILRGHAARAGAWDDRQLKWTSHAAGSVAFAVAFLLLLSACGGPESVRGQIVDVRSRGVLDLESVDLVDEAGARWTFEGSGVLGHFTPSHLRQHMVSGEMVEVAFLREEGRLIVVGLRDYR